LKSNKKKKGKEKTACSIIYKSAKKWIQKQAQYAKSKGMKHFAKSAGVGEYDSATMGNKRPTKYDKVPARKQKAKEEEWPKRPAWMDKPAKPKYRKRSYKSGKRRR